MSSRLLIFIASCLLLPACSWLKDPPPNLPAPPQKDDPTDELVGRVAMVSPDRSFVLIQRLHAGRFPQDCILTTSGENQRTANIRFSGESHGSYNAADIQSGSVEVGDSVYLPPTSTPQPIHQ